MLTCPICLNEYYKEISIQQPKFNGMTFDCLDCGIKTIYGYAKIHLDKLPKNDPRRIELIKYIKSINDQRIIIDEDLLKKFNI